LAARRFEDAGIPGPGLFSSRGLEHVRHVGAADEAHDVDKAWWGAVRYYSTNQEDKMPPAGRYNAGQKFLFWGFFWSTVALLASESCCGSRNAYRGISLLEIHFRSHSPRAALFTIGLFLIHIYMGVFAERGAFGSVIRGDVSIAFAKRYPPRLV